ncbi:MBL fold metallo-hydrolase [Thioclava sp. FR2]|uniref:MBL fold metallo-hydrolase n=1 Tax=Thioclava sp. FR2 TaxID=3445780 RepID=UPI003EB6DDBC
MILPALSGHRLKRLTILDCGTFSVRGGERIIGLPAYLLETDQGAKLLVDGGFPPSYATDPDAAAAADGLPRFGALTDHHDIASELARTGTRIEDLTAHILTHGHIDHVGALSRITCPLIVTAIERADPKPCYFGTARPVDWPMVENLTINDQTQLCDGITLLPTPGHTPGHMSLLLTLPETGPVILAADAINRASEPDEGYPDADDPITAHTTGSALMKLSDKLGALFIYGHDPAQWPDLRKAPAFYD